VGLKAWNSLFPQNRVY